MAQKNPDLSPGHQDAFDNSEDIIGKIDALEQEIKNDEFAIRLWKERLGKPKYTEEQKADFVTQIAASEEHMKALKAQIAQLKQSK